jgi:hypothetical protein
MERLWTHFVEGVPIVSLGALRCHLDAVGTIRRPRLGQDTVRQPLFGQDIVNHLEKRIDLFTPSLEFGLIRCRRLLLLLVVKAIGTPLAFLRRRSTLASFSKIAINFAASERRSFTSSVSTSLTTLGFSPQRMR